MSKTIKGEILPNMDYAVRCSDSYDNIQNFNLPRGKSGLAIAWKNTYRIR